MYSAGLGYYVRNLEQIFYKNRIYKGWGRKRTGRFALWCNKRFAGKLTLLEDSFIRSIGLGVDGSPSFSIVEDDVGIYYDATAPSKLENCLNTYAFMGDEVLMKTAREAIVLMKSDCVSKYNSAPLVDDRFRIQYGMTEKSHKILVIAQTAGDASLKYGMLDDYGTDEMIDAALSENPDSKVYLKVHPDVLSGKKESDIDIEVAKEKCIIIDDDVNPVSLLKEFEKVYTKTSQMGFEALLVGCECVCFGMPFYAGWGVTDDRSQCGRRKRQLSVEEIFAAAYILYTRYYNPYTKKTSNILDTISTIVRYRERDRKEMVEGCFFGFSIWKHPFMTPFVNNIKAHNFINPFFSKKYLSQAKLKGLDEKSRIYIWGKKEFDEVEQYAQEKGIQIVRVEDGFIRSVGLGSDLTQPYSLVIDSRGIYFDPTQESDLEYLLNFNDFSDDELERAKKLRQHLIAKKLSKYNNYADVRLDLPTDRKIILVPGQVEDDASIRLGAKGMTNLALLQAARECSPQAYIVFKPHPDVLAGNRVGNVAEVEALTFCDRVVTEVSLDSVLSLCDEVHTMTSLVGFEALMRGIKVYTYGMPFYAGWGLSEDSVVCERRKRKLSIDELTAATLLLYPRYIDPLTNELCEVEVTLLGLQKEKTHLDASFSYRWSRKIRNLISRKVQLFFRILKSIT